jgi:hypothetical protein
MKKTKFESDLFYYGNYLELIGSFSLSKQLTQKDLGDTPEDKAVIQKCYRDMKREGFKGTVIDYLCLISCEFILNSWHKEWENTEDDGINETAGKLLSKSHIKTSGKYNKHQFLPLILIMFLLVCRKHKIHARNMLRLFNKNPQFILEHEGMRSFNRLLLDIAKITLNVFNLMMIFNCYEFLREKMEVIDETSENNLWEYLLPSAVETLVGRKDFFTREKPKKDIKFNWMIYG